MVVLSLKQDAAPPGLGTALTSPCSVAQDELGALDRANELDEQARALMLEAEKLRAGLQHKQVTLRLVLSVRGCVRKYLRSR